MLVVRLTTVPLATGWPAESTTIIVSVTFGPAGMLEQDDGENWGQSTRGMVGSVSRDYRLNYSMSLNRGEIINDELSPPRIQTQTNEHPQLWHYRAWSEWMSSSSWQELKATHSQVPLDRV